MTLGDINTDFTLISTPEHQRNQLHNRVELEDGLLVTRRRFGFSQELRRWSHSHQAQIRVFTGAEKNPRSEKIPQSHSPTRHY